MKQYWTLGLIAAALLLSGCAKETSLPTATGKGSIRALNAIPESPEVAFLIEERLIGTVGFKNVTRPAEYDDLEYTFNFDTVLAGDTTGTRVASQFLDVQADVDYTLVITGAIEAPDVSIWETGLREWSGTETVFELRASHLADSLGQIDIYITDPATPPALGSQFATLGLGEIGTSGDIETGEYVITVTPAGDDTTILYVSAPVTFAAQTQFILSIFDGDENDLAPVSTRLFNLVTGGTAALADSRFPPQIRFIHASLNFGGADIYIDDPLTTPIVSNHMFRDITGFIDVTAGDLPFTYTAPGNTGSILLDFDETIFAGARTDLFVVRNVNDTDTPIITISDRRPISTFARFSVIHTANGHNLLDVYLVPSGELIDEVLPRFPLVPLGTNPIQLPIVPDDYDIYVTDAGEKIILAGPIAMSAALGDVIETIIYENVDPNVVDFAFIPPP
jgi:hypothetical protein